MMNALVGYTGFVGSNIYGSGRFDAAYNSKNIEEAFGTKPDLLVYSGLRAEKYLANNEPEKDRALIDEAYENIKRIGARRLVLISTIDVFKDPKNADEKTVIDTQDLHPYGYNRYILECRVRDDYPDALIVRLPALFGKNIKKNFQITDSTMIYDIAPTIGYMFNVEPPQVWTGRPILSIFEKR